MCDCRREDCDMCKDIENNQPLQTIHFSKVGSMVTLKESDFRELVTYYLENHLSQRINIKEDSKFLDVLLLDMAHKGRG